MKNKIFGWIIFFIFIEHSLAPYFIGMYKEKPVLFIIWSAGLTFLLMYVIMLYNGFKKYMEANNDKESGSNRRAYKRKARG